jgi:hypothetical protein
LITIDIAQRFPKNWWLSLFQGCRDSHLWAFHLDPVHLPHITSPLTLALKTNKPHSTHFTSMPESSGSGIL